MLNFKDKEISLWKLRTITKDKLWAISYGSKKNDICKSKDIDLLKAIIKEHNDCIKLSKEKYKELADEYCELWNNYDAGFE